MDSEVVRLVAARATPAAIRGRPTEVLSALEPLDARDLRAAASRRADLRLPVLEADALTRLGRLDEADALLRPFEADAARRGAALVRRGACARPRSSTRGATSRAAEAALTRAIETSTALGMPYETALGQLELGEALRRRGQRRRGAGC